jgi:hypothetical protein
MPKMRVLQILTPVLLATAVRADILPCQLTLLGSGVTCTEGILTFHLSSNAPPNTIVEPIAGGLALVGDMPGGGGGTSIQLSVTVPKYWAIIGVIFDWPKLDIIDFPNAPPGINTTGISSIFSGYSANGIQTTFQPDFNPEGNYSSPCLGCGLPSIFFLEDDPNLGDATTIVDLNTQTIGGPATVERWDIGGFDAVAPEPSALLLLTTAAGLLGWRVRHLRGL